MIKLASTVYRGSLWNEKSDQQIRWIHGLANFNVIGRGMNIILASLLEGWCWT